MRSGKDVGRVVLDIGDTISHLAGMENNNRFETAKQLFPFDKNLVIFRNAEPQKKPWCLSSLSNGHVVEDITITDIGWSWWLQIPLIQHTPSPDLRDFMGFLSNLGKMPRFAPGFGNVPAHQPASDFGKLWLCLEKWWLFKPQKKERLVFLVSYPSIMNSEPSMFGQMFKCSVISPNFPQPPPAQSPWSYRFARFASHGLRCYSSSLLDFLSSARDMKTPDPSRRFLGKKGLKKTEKLDGHR